MWKTFFRKKKRIRQQEPTSDQLLLEDVLRLNTFLSAKLDTSVQAEALRSFSKTFFEAPSTAIIKELPAFYLKYEEYLTKIVPERILTKAQLRAVVHEQFPLLVEQDSLHFLFQNAIAEEVFLGKFFVELVVEDIIHLFGQGQDHFFLKVKAWLAALPHNPTPIPFIDPEVVAKKDLKALLHLLSHEICGRLEEKMGDRFTQKVFDRNYEAIARKYKYLSSFPYVISLIPRKFLDTDKIGLLSNHQLAATLLDQVNHLEELNATLADQNQALKETKEQLKAIQQAQEKTLRELQESNRNLEQFAFVASHDLQEPLRTIEGYINLINKEVEVQTNQQLSEFVGHAIGGVTRMQGLIMDLLNYSRVGKNALKIVEIDMPILMKVVCYNLRHIIEEAGARITTDNLVNLCADRTQMIQLFQNLVANAVKFSREGIAPEIIVSCHSQPTHWLCAVKDNGIGVDAEAKEEIFTLFKRLAPANQYQGSGIGLAICKKIVERHQGEIWVESEPGRGSTFYFTIKKSLNLQRHPQ